MNPNAPSWNPPPGMAIPNILGNRNGYASNSYNSRKIMEKANNMRIPNIVNNGNNNFKNMMREVNQGRQHYLVNEPLSRKSRKNHSRSRKNRKSPKSRKSRSRK